MSTGDILFAVNASNTNALAYNGELKGMDAQTNLRGIASIYPSVFHFAVSKSSGIASFADMKGTRGAVGAAGSATDVYTQHVLEAAGLSYDDIEVTYSDISSAADLLKDGHIDWAHLPLGVPGSTMLDLALTGKINILPIEGIHRDTLIERRPYYVPYVIPGGTYDGFPDDIESAACVITLVCDASVNEDLVYQITKALWENLDEVHAINKSCEWMDINHATDGIGVPLHPGAEKYYKEIG
jgi:TRAP transporter TAXI family solute receptor